MRIIRRRNWLIKRIALGLAIAAFAAPVAQARVDEGIPGQPNAANESFKPIPYLWPSSADKIQKGIAFRQFVTDFPSYPAGSVADIGALPVSARDYALAHIERVRLAHSLPRWRDPGIVATNYGTPGSIHASRPSPHDPALARGDHGSAANAHKPHLLGGALARGDSQASWSQIAPLLADQRSATGFDWKDAGIGAALALALVLLSGGAVLATRRAGRAQTA
jgi:hypothetical protein